MRKYVALQKDKTILVRTPKPYIVDAYKKASPDHMRQIMYKLNEDAKFLYDCLKLLRMPILKARKLNLTLNRESGNKLVNMIIENYYVSNEMKKAIGKHKWQKL